MPCMSLLGQLSEFFLRLVAWAPSQLLHFPNWHDYLCLAPQQAWHHACQARAGMAYFGQLPAELVHRVENWPLLEARTLISSPGFAPLNPVGIQGRSGAETSEWATPVGISELTGALLWQLVSESSVVRPKSYLCYDLSIGWRCPHHTSCSWCCSGLSSVFRLF